MSRLAWRGMKTTEPDLGILFAVAGGLFLLVQLALLFVRQPFATTGCLLAGGLAGWCLARAVATTTGARSSKVNR